MCGGAHLADAAGRAVDGIGPHGLDRIDDHEVGLFASIVVRMSRSEVAAASRFTGALAQPEALRPHPYLRAGLLARNVERAQPGLRKARGGLQQQRGFADPRIAADKDGACRDEAAPQHAVQLIQPRARARRRCFLGGQIRQLQDRSARAAQCLRTRPGGQRRFLDDRAPFAAGIAAALPFRMARAAGGAGEGGRVSGHGRAHAPSAARRQTRHVAGPGPAGLGWHGQVPIRRPLRQGR